MQRKYSRLIVGTSPHELIFVFFFFLGGGGGGRLGVGGLGGYHDSNMALLHYLTE